MEVFLPIKKKKDKKKWKRSEKATSSNRTCRFLQKSQDVYPVAR